MLYSKAERIFATVVAKFLRTVVEVRQRVSPEVNWSDAAV